MDNDKLNSLLRKSLARTLDEEEHQQLYNWLMESDGNKRSYARMRDVDTLLNIEAHTAVPKRRLHRRWALSAACAVLAFGIFSTLLWQLPSHTPDSLPTNEILLISAENTYTIDADTTIVEQKELLRKVKNEQSAYNRLLVPQGKVFSVRLDDQTVVHLNSMSELHFPAEFTGNTRSVKLTGEAFFDVARDTTRPFIVETRHNKIEVLGTQFNVSAYTEDTQETISLLEGCVQTTVAGKTEKLLPNEQLAFTIDSRQMEKTTFKAEEITAWMNGIFFFEDRPLGQVLKALERWYQVKFEFADPSFLNIPVYIRLSKEKPIETLLQALESTQKLTFQEKKENLYYISINNAKH